MKAKICDIVPWSIVRLPNNRLATIELNADPERRGLALVRFENGAGFYLDPDTAVNFIASPKNLAVAYLRAQTAIPSQHVKWTSSAAPAPIQSAQEIEQQQTERTCRNLKAFKQRHQFV